VADDPNPDPKPSGEGDKTFTQSDIDRIVADRLGREKSKYADYDDLKAKAEQFDEHQAANESETDKLRKQVEQLTKTQTEATTKALRAEVAMAKGLTAAQAKRLVGATQEELEADADEILEAFPAQQGKGAPPTRKPAADLTGGSDPTEEPAEMDPRKLAESVPPY
jgi:hypothetical protein